MQLMQEPLKAAVDGVSLATVVATLIGALPTIAALVSIVWGLIRIYETRTVQRMLFGVSEDMRDGS
jgi:chromate transport protein ChrA